jgi:hypothetical protein
MDGSLILYFILGIFSFLLAAGVVWAVKLIKYLPSRIDNVFLEPPSSNSKNNNASQF